MESGDWFAMEFTSPDRRKGWATIIRLSQMENASYFFKPKGLNEDREYTVTFDNSHKIATLKGSDLMHRGFEVQPGADQASELLLWEEK